MDEVHVPGVGTVVTPNGAAKPKKKKPKKKAPAKRKAKKAVKRKLPKKAKRKAPKQSGNVIRTERLDMRLSKAEKAKLTVRAKKRRQTITQVVLAAIGAMR